MVYLGNINPIVQFYNQVRQEKVPYRPLSCIKLQPLIHDLCPHIHLDPIHSTRHHHSPIEFHIHNISWMVDLLGHHLQLNLGLGLEVITFGPILIRLFHFISLTLGHQILHYQSQVWILNLGLKGCIKGVRNSQDFVDSSSIHGHILSPD